eukprot:gene4142-4391_t
MAKSGQFDAVICIGVVFNSYHTSAALLVLVIYAPRVPVVFGVLTCDTMEQALDRAGGKVGNKGGEAAITAIEMANLMASLRADGLAAPAWGPAK